MAQAFKCDLTGEVCEGTPAKVAVAKLSDTLEIHARLYVRVSPRELREGDLAPMTVAKMEKTLETLQALKSKK